MASQTEYILERYAVERGVYECFTIKIEELIRELLSIYGLKYHLVESRTKDVESLREKIGRPEKKYKKSLSEIPDLSGIRIIVYYIDDVDKIREMILGEFDAIEIEYGHQPESYGADQFGYISLHMVVRLGAARDVLKEWANYQGLHAEIQLRTVLQHGWAVISHALQYKRGAEVPMNSQRKLNRLAGLLELADEQFLELRNDRELARSEAKRLIQINNEDVEIDSASIQEFLNASKNIEKIMTESTKYNFFYGKIPDYNEEEYEYIGDIVGHCKRLKIRTLGELRAEMNFDVLPFLKIISEKSGDVWYVNRAFILLLLLIRARIDDFGVAILVQSDGWHRDIAERVIRGAKKHAALNRPALRKPDSSAESKSED